MECNANCWCGPADRKGISKVKGNCIDIYSVHKQSYDEEEIWNSANEKRDAETPALVYKRDSHGFIKEPIELSIKMHIEDEILQDENVVEPSEWDRIPSRPSSAVRQQNVLPSTLSESKTNAPKTQDTTAGDFTNFAKGYQPEKGDETEYANTFVTQNYMD